MVIFAHNIERFIMRNAKHIIEEASVYFTKILGENVDFKPVGKDLQGRIPVSVSSYFTFFEGCLLGHPVLLACLADGDDIPPAQMKKLLDIVMRQTGMIVVMATPSVSSYNKVRLVAQKVNFVIPGSQMFLPSLLIEIKPDRVIGADLKDSIPPFAQFLLLYHLQVASIAGASSYELSDRFSVSYGTINKALRWLVSKDLIRMDGVRTKTIQMDLKGHELWEKALPILVSPVEQVFYTDAVLGRQLTSGVSALSAYMARNEEPSPCYAMAKKELKSLEIEYDKRFGENRIELWKYNPSMLSTTGVVDRLSLYLSLKDDKDEQIQVELKRLMEEIQWLED